VKRIIVAFDHTVTHTHNTHTHTHTHTLGTLPGRLIGPSQRLLPIRHNIRKGRTSVLPEGFEPAIPESERP